MSLPKSAPLTQTPPGLRSALRIPAADRPYWLLVTAWVLMMISVPIQRWLWGDSILPTALTLAVFLQAAATLAVLLRGWGARRTLLTTGLILFLGWLIEFIGSRTGFPFGVYSYTAALQPQLASVPILIPLAWYMMLPAAWAVAAALVGLQRRWVFVAVSAIAMTAWDLFLDPQKVAWGMWQWPGGGEYFGIPLSNYLGWLLSAALMTALARPAAVPRWPLLTMYGITWALQSIGLGVFWGMPGPALVGCLGMGALFITAAWKTWREREA